MKKSRMLGVVCAITAIFAISTPSSQAAIVFNWEFDEPTGTVNPGEWAIANATMTLDASSDSVTFTTGFNGEVGAGTGNGGIFDGFDLHPNGLGTFFSQFAGVSLNPLDSFSFTFGAYSASPTAMEGEVGFASPSTSFSVFGTTGTLLNGFTRTAVVPIPAAAWLFGTGLVGLIGMARRKKA